MTLRSAVVAMAGLATGLIATASAQERQIGGGVGLTVFANRNFQGRSATLRNDVRDLRAIGLDDSVSSLEAAPGEEWEVCERPDYRGRCVVVSGSEADLRTSGWNDTISSARRLRGGGGGYPPPVGYGLELFSREGYGGDRRSLNGPEPDLRRLGFDNAARSLRIGPRETWEVCADAYFRECRVVKSDWGDLERLGMSRRISSARPWGSGGAGGRAFLTLYDDRGFRGRSYRVDRDAAVLFGFINRAESVRVSGGESWELCDGWGYGGRCAVVTRDLADLSSLGLRNRVQSVRLLRTPR